jgi:protein-S-isoprenylcysteine O-methyltransferase Ste14
MTTQQTSSGVRIFPPAIHLVSIAIGFLLQWAAPIPMFGMRIPGVLLIAIALALMIWSVIVMSRAGTTPNPTRPTTALVTHGPFRLTRNPMYLAWELVVVGVGLAANAPWVILMAVPAAFLTRRLVIDKEERYLAAKFGPEFEDYRSRVRRWA